MLARLHHYLVSHQGIPIIFHRDSDEFAENLQKHGADYLKFYWDLTGKHPLVTEVIPPDGLACQIQQMPQGIMLGIITFPPPKFVTEVYFAAVVYRKKKFFERALARYITLEQALKISDELPTQLCEWTQDRKHLNFGAGPPPTISGFYEAISRLLRDRA